MSLNCIGFWLSAAWIFGTTWELFLPTSLDYADLTLASNATR